jgi:hypothetical protein
LRGSRQSPSTDGVLSVPKSALSLRQRRKHARNSFEMLGTVVLVHGANGWLFTNKGGGWEYPAF